MPLLFRYDNQDQEFYRNSTSVNDFHSISLIEKTDSVALENGKLTFQNWYFDGYRLANSVLNQQNPFTYSVGNTLDVVRIYFNRKGNTAIRYDQLNKGFIVNGGQHSMIYSPELSTSMTHTGDVSEIFSLQLTKQCFFDLIGEENTAMLKFAEHVAGNRPVIFSDNWLPTNFRIEQCINEIINCQYISDLRKAYLKSKAIELFVLFVNAANQHAGSKKSFINSNTDKEKLLYARDYILKNYTKAISLAGLAKTCQLNEFKLKSGFKELFGTSVIDFLIQQRLMQAKLLLLEKKMNVNEVAHEIGYASSQYFTKAFKQKFGISPTRLR